jgi:hypothetical protein
MSARWAFLIQVRRIGIFVKIQLCCFIEKLRRSGILVAIIAKIFSVKLHRRETSFGIKSIYHPAGVFGALRVDFLSRKMSACWAFLIQVHRIAFS